ncbi:MAG: cell wall hydrolase [Sphingobium sp.]
MAVEAERRQTLLMAVAALLLVALPVAGTGLARLGLPPAGPAQQIATAIRPPASTPPPKVEPVKVLELAPDDARKLNAAVPFSTAPNPAARPFLFSGSNAERDRAIDCLAAAQYYEAGDDPVGQKAVAQVVLNRVRHPAFPKSVCAVVFEGAERKSGCQFTFTCDGAMARTPPDAAWTRARVLARRMLAGLVDRKVGYATHYHTDWVVPYWSASLDKITEVHTHLFFRWSGWWGTPGAFLRSVSTTEPQIALLSRLSPSHEAPAGLSPDGLTAPQMTQDAAQMAAGRIQLEGPTLPGGVKLVATSPEKDSFIVSMPRAMATGDYLAFTRNICSGRQRCRIMGWRSDTSPPGAFPIPDRALSSMLFSYIHDAPSGLQRLLWNCRRIPQDDPRNCMRERVPLGQLIPSASGPSAPKAAPAP